MPLPTGRVRILDTSVGVRNRAVPPEVIAGLPREKQAYFREAWIADFRTRPATHNTLERWVDADETPIDSAGGQIPNHRP